MPQQNPIGTDSNWRPWYLIILPGIPFILAFAHFYSRFAPAAMVWLFPESATGRAIVLLLTALALFGFYGTAAGWTGYGLEAHFMAVISLFVLMPVFAITIWRLTARFS